MTWRGWARIARAAPLGQGPGQERDDLLVLHVARRGEQADSPRAAHGRDDGVGERPGGVAGRVVPGHCSAIRRGKSDDSV